MIFDGFEYKKNKSKRKRCHKTNACFYIQLTCSFDRSQFSSNRQYELNSIKVIVRLASVHVILTINLSALHCLKLLIGNALINKLTVKIFCWYSNMVLFTCASMINNIFCLVLILVGDIHVCFVCSNGSEWAWKKNRNKWQITCNFLYSAVFNEYFILFVRFSYIYS